MTATAEGELVGVRHELARRATLAQIPDFDRIELHRRALTALAEPPNDPNTLAALAFHADQAGEVEATIRYGIAENLYGHQEIGAFRAARSPVGLARSLARTVITTFGRDFATASTLFQRPTTPGKVGRQMQSWARTPDGWRIVAAHVSVIDDV